MKTWKRIIRINFYGDFSIINNNKNLTFYGIPFASKNNYLYSPNSLEEILCHSPYRAFTVVPVFFLFAIFVVVTPTENSIFHENEVNGEKLKKGGHWSNMELKKKKVERKFNMPLRGRFCDRQARVARETFMESNKPCGGTLNFSFFVHAAAMPSLLSDKCLRSRCRWRDNILIRT